MRVIIFAACILLFESVMALNSFARNNTHLITTDSSSPAIDSKDPGFEKTPVNKLARGVTNIAFFWLEIPMQMKKTAKEDNEFVGGTVGIIKGFFIGTLRLATGVFDMVTFIIPPYNHPLMEPEYVFHDPDY